WTVRVVWTVKATLECFMVVFSARVDMSTATRGSPVVTLRICAVRVSFVCHSLTASLSFPPGTLCLSARLVKETLWPLFVVMHSVLCSRCHFILFLAIVE